MAETVFTGTINTGNIVLLISSGGTRYAVFKDSSTIRIYKRTGTSWSSESSATDPTGTGGEFDAQIDSNDDIWVAVSGSSSVVPQYNRYDTGTTSWDGWSNIIPSYTETAQDSNNTIAIDIDSNDFVVFLFTNWIKNKGVEQRYIYMRWWNGVSLSTPSLVVSTVDANHRYAQLQVRGSMTSSGVAEAMWWDDTNTLLRVRTYTDPSGWGTASTYTNGSVPYNGHDRIVYDAAAYRYSTYLTTLYENDSSTSESAGNVLSATVISGIRYVISRDVTNTDEVNLLEYDTSWTETALEDTGTAIDAVALFNNYNNNNNPTDRVCYLFSYSGDLFYSELTAGTDTSDSQAAFLTGAGAASDSQSAFLSTFEGQIFRADHEEGNLTDWSTEVDTGNNLSVTNLSALLGSYEISLETDDAVAAYVTRTLTNYYSYYIGYRFTIDPNSAMTNGEGFGIGQVRLSASPNYISWIDFRKNVTSGSFEMRAGTYDDTVTPLNTSWYEISDEPHCAEIRHKRETADGQADGWLEFYIDEQLKQTITGIDDYNAWQLITHLRFGKATVITTPTTGTIYLDDVIMRDDGTLIGCPLGTATSDDWPAYLKGQDTASDSQSAYLTGSQEASDSQSAYLEGIASATDSWDAYLAGQDTAVDNQIAYLKGSQDASDTQSAFLAGSLEATDNWDAYLTGQDTATDSQPAYLVGSSDATDNQSAYLTGSDTAVDNQSAYLKGSADTSSSWDAYLTGQVLVTDSQSAYLEGSAVEASDSQDAFLKGQDTSSDSQTAYLTGVIAASDSQEAYLTGNVLVTSSQSAYLSGQDSATSSENAYLAGQDSAVDNQTAFLAGSLDDYSSQSAFLAGSIDAVSNTNAFLQGSSDAFTNWEAYLKGQDSAANSQSAYLHGSISVASSKHAYLKGQNTSSDTQAAYLEGISSASSSTDAFLEGCGEVLNPDGDISQSGSWKKEDAGTTNLYVSVDEWPEYDDDDYVWHESVSGAEYFEVTLENPAYETIGAGDVKIFWRGKRISGTGTVTMRVQLRQGSSTVIAQSDEVFTDNIITYSYTLSSGEKSSITDWTDLRLRFIVQGVV